MPIVIQYEKTFEYSLGQPNVPNSPKRPLLPIRISYKDQSTDKLALVDSGADCIVFPKTIARIFGIDLAGLESSSSSGIGGRVPTWYEQFDVTVMGLTKNCKVAIVDNDDTPYLLGRAPFFSFLQIGFRESKLEFYLSSTP